MGNQEYLLPEGRVALIYYYEIRAFKIYARIKQVVTGCFRGTQVCIRLPIAI
jgi:hypothetical protein